MAQTLALLLLLKKLMLKELSSFSSVRFNNFLFSILFILLRQGWMIMLKIIFQIKTTTRQ